MPDNTVTLVGNVTRDPELRFTPSGAANASFGLAVNRRWQNRQTQEWDEQVSFFDVVCWREMAENVSESLTRILVTSAPRLRWWLTRLLHHFAGLLHKSQEMSDEAMVEVLDQLLPPHLPPLTTKPPAQATATTRSPSNHGP